MALTSLFAISGQKKSRFEEPISTFLGQNGTDFVRCHFRAQKSLDFQGPTLPMALVMHVAHIKIITSRAI
jgi:hypothetical protein